MEIIQRFALPLDSDYVGKSARTIPAIDKISAGMLWEGFQNCFPAIEGKNMSLHINGKAIWDAPRSGTYAINNGVLEITSTVSWPSNAKLIAELQP